MVTKKTPTLDVYAAVEGIDGDVIFRMVTSPSGRWRVQQVIAPGPCQRSTPQETSQRRAVTDVASTR